MDTYPCPPNGVAKSEGRSGKHKLTAYHRANSDQAGAEPRVASAFRHQVGPQKVRVVSTEAHLRRIELG